MLKFPTHVQLEITDICNLRCMHCYHFDTKKKQQSKDLEDEKITEIVNKIIDAGVYSLVITGGEPLARPELLLKIVGLAKQAGMFVSINSNLLLLNSCVLNELKKLKLDSFLVSCPASNLFIYNKITRGGDYNIFLSKLKLLMDSDIPFLINMVVTKNNFNFIRSTAKELSNIGIKRFAATPASLNVEYPDEDDLLDKSQILCLLDDLRWCSEELKLKVDILEPIPKCFFPDWCWDEKYSFTKRTCPAGRISVTISNTGDVRPCSHNPNVYGNLFLSDLENIWLNLEEYRKKSIPLMCNDCEILNLCYGSCRTNALATTKSISEPDRLTVYKNNFPKKEIAEIVLNDDSRLFLKGKIKWRKEIDCYSVVMGNRVSNLILVNEEMFKFIKYLENNLPLTLKELFIYSSSEEAKKDFENIIKVLIRKKIIFAS